jgi:hypothetical protein
MDLWCCALRVNEFGGSLFLQQASAFAQFGKVQVGYEPIGHTGLGPVNQVVSLTRQLAYSHQYAVSEAVPCSMPSTRRISSTFPTGSDPVVGHILRSTRWPSEFGSRRSAGCSMQMFKITWTWLHNAPVVMKIE